MRPADSALGVLGIRTRIYASRDARFLNLSQVVASVFHFRIVNTPPASISIHFRKFSARQFSENTIVKRVYYMNRSVFPKARYMNGIHVGFEILAGTLVPQLPPSYLPPPREGEMEFRDNGNGPSLI